jgi:HD-GYP domain-containing protein (c-di-GMP phosphodiesterase class II)/DNA-directed RNA polymerase subunit RPC12/RpoP
MKTAKLDYLVHTLDNRLLLPAGKELTSEALDELIATNKDTSYQALSFLEHGTVYKDMLSFLQKPPYNIIFEKLNKTVTLTIMKKISFIHPLLKFLDYFKESDFYTYRHSLVVFAMSINLARDLLEEPEDWIMTLMAGTIHDFGKICVPLRVLKSNDPLTRAERSILEHHTLAGYVLLCYLLQDRRSFAAQVAKEHHERRDGSGYPLGISLRDRMVEIIAVCDVYDALLSPRPYRPTPYDNRTALEEITEMAKKGKFSWEVVQTLVSHNRRDKPHFRECEVSTEKRGIPPADNLYGVFVEKEIKCPNCHGSCIKKKTHKEYKEGVDYISYECPNCGKEFDEDDLLNIEMDKH